MSVDRGMDQKDVEYRSVIEKNDIMPFAATWMELEIIKLSEASKREEEKYHVSSLIYGIRQKIHVNIFTKQTHRLREGTYGYQAKVEGVG